MMDWLSNNAQFVTSMTVIFVILHVILVAALYLVLLERKICAWVQDRVGPNRVGPLGLLQPIADSVKLIVKEEFIPPGGDKTLFVIAPILTVIPALISFVILPWGGTFQTAAGDVKIMGADVNIGIVYLIAVTSLGVYGVVLGGWASNSKFSFLGGLRASAQMVSYEIPLGLTLLAAILTAGTIRPDVIVSQQVAGQWYILQQPLAALLFYVCMLAEANRAPFDLAEAESELVGGWHTEYSSLKWALFFMGEYGHVFVGSALFSILFLGGWSINPLTGLDLPLATSSIFIILLQVGVMMGKVFALIVLTMVIRWTVPRFRFDQLMRLAWEGMIPTALALLLMTSLFVYLGMTHMLWLGSLVLIAVIWLIRPLLPRQANPNHRVPLIGSRFSPLVDGVQANGQRRANGRTTADVAG